MLFRSFFHRRGDTCCAQTSRHTLSLMRVSPLRLTLGAIALSTLLFIGNTSHAWANTDQMMLELSLSADADAQKVLRQAESLVSATLDQRFSQDTTLSALEVVILGNQNGQILPMMTTTVSREQWDANPQVELWTAYSSSFSALFYPSRPPEVVVARPPQPQAARRPQTPRQSTARRLPERSVIQIERAYDQGQLSRQQLNDFVDLLD